MEGEIKLKGTVHTTEFNGKIVMIRMMLMMIMMIAIFSLAQIIIIIEKLGSKTDWTTLVPRINFKCVIKSGFVLE
jgi:hypothetical protein